MITVDTAVLGRRERDVRAGFTMPPQLGPRTLIDGALHPAWTWAFARSDPITFANVPVGDGDAVSLSGFVAEQFDPSLSWSDIEWFRANWDGHIVIKGIQTVDDARLAVDHGVDGIALSNHGGRQLDGAPPPIELVAPVKDAVGDSVVVICDGGVRRGSDIVKAVALGADACMIGRAYLYALGAAGEAGVTWLLKNLRAGTERTLVLLGATLARRPHPRPRGGTPLTASHVRARVKTTRRCTCDLLGGAEDAAEPEPVDAVGSLGVGPHGFVEPLRVLADEDAPLPCPHAVEDDLRRVRRGERRHVAEHGAHPADELA